VIGIDIWNQSTDALLGFINQTGITFPIAKGGDKISQDYAAGNNSLYLIDQNGILQATTSVTETQTDSTVNTIAAKISELLNVAVVDKAKPAKRIQPSMISKHPVIHGMYNLAGRKLDSKKPASGLRIELLKKKISP
jgi:hypothetical protein